MRADVTFAKAAETRCEVPEYKFQKAPIIYRKAQLQCMRHLMHFVATLTRCGIHLFLLPMYPSLFSPNALSFFLVLQYFLCNVKSALQHQLNAKTDFHKSPHKVHRNARSRTAKASSPNCGSHVLLSASQDNTAHRLGALLSFSAPSFLDFRFFRSCHFVRDLQVRLEEFVHWYLCMIVSSKGTSQCKIFLTFFGN